MCHHELGFKNLDVLCQQFPIVIYSIYYVYIYIYIHHIFILTVHLPFDTLKQYCSSLSIHTPAVDTSVTSTRGARPSAARAMDALESTSEAMTPCQPKCWENPVHQAIPLPCPVEQDDPASSSPGEPGEISPLFKPKVLVAPGQNNPWQPSINQSLNQTRLDGCLDATKSEFQIFIGLKANHHPTSWSGCVLLPNPAASHLGMFLMLALPWSTRSLSLQKKWNLPSSYCPGSNRKESSCDLQQVIYRAWRIFVSSWSLWARSDNLKVLEASRSVSRRVNKTGILYQVRSFCIQKAGSHFQVS